MMVDLLPRLQDYGYEVDLCVLAGQRTPFFDVLEEAGVKVISLSQSGMVYDPRYICRLRRLMRQYDIVHTHNTASQLFAAIAGIGLGKRLYTTEHNTTNRRRAWRWYIPIDRWMYSRYDHVICISEATKTNLLTYLGTMDGTLSHTQLHVVHNGVPLQRFLEAPPSNEILQTYSGKHMAIMVAGFRPQKDQDTLIRAFKLLPDDYHLLLVGDGERHDEIVALVDSLGLQGRVHLLGWRTDIPELLKAADVVVLSSHYEGLSLACIEGMICGKPFVASDVEGLHEVVDGYGVLFAHQDAAALASVIQRLSIDTEYAAEVAARCQEKAMQYNIEKMVNEYHQCYVQ